MPSQADIDLFIRNSIAKAALPIIKEIESALFAHIQSPSRASTLNGLLASSEALQRTLVINRRAEMLCVMLAAQRAAMQKVLAKGNINYESKELLKMEWEREETKIEKVKDVERELTTLMWLWGARMARIWEREVANSLGLPALPVLWGDDERLMLAEPEDKNVETEIERHNTWGEQLKRKEPPEIVGDMMGTMHEGYTNAKAKPKRKSILKPPRKCVKFVEGC